MRTVNTSLPHHPPGGDPGRGKKSAVAAEKNLVIAAIPSAKLVAPIVTALPPLWYLLSPASLTTVKAPMALPPFPL
jgi:hypothetical protein